MAYQESPDPVEVKIPKQHIVMFASDGSALEPRSTTEYVLLSEPDFHAYVADIIEALESLPSVDGRRRMVIFVHGGLNTQRRTVERAVRLTPQMLNDGVFPLFLNWRSSLNASYLEHLLHVRQGKRQGVLGIPLAPFIMVSDLLRAAGRAIPVWALMVQSDLLTIPWLDSERPTDDAAIALFQNQLVRIVGPKAVDESERYRRFAQYVATLPTKLMTSPAIDAFGMSAWRVMLRHIDLLFEPPGRTEDGAVKGGLLYLLESLRAAEERGQRETPLEITLVGHSMGTIVVNRIIRTAGDTLPIKHVVYLAAACSLKDYEDTMFPFLKSHTDVNLFHLVLNRQAELRDRAARNITGDIAPRGSLLVWIDNFLGAPNSFRDLTAGRFVNLIRETVSVPPAADIRKRIHITYFDAGKKYDRAAPQRHGDFGDLRFWRTDCWFEAWDSGSGGCYGGGLTER
jgi:pimeloyl-ACP methyl ester carboxylesterase